MRTKAIKDLVQLDETNFFETIADGIKHILKNASAMLEDAEILYKQNHQRGNSVLQALANEEAAKVLILIDAVRCPKKLKENLSKQLSWFNHHLAKGIYSEACYWKMESYGELLEAVESEREKYYLDGPNDIDWIFFNRILGEREETIYVDYVEIEGNYFWQFPKDSQFLNKPVSCALDLCMSMKELGILTPIGLKEMSNYWEGIQITEDFHYMKLRELYLDMIYLFVEKGIIQNSEGRHVSCILESWQFPMYLLDFTLSKEDNTQKLREIQDNWYQE